jgi:hypothetical protein
MKNEELVKRLRELGVDGEIWFMNGKIYIHPPKEEETVEATPKEKEFCRIVQNDGWTKVVLPDGKEIPHQTDIELKQGISDRGLAWVTLGIMVRIGNGEHDEIYK